MLYTDEMQINLALHAWIHNDNSFKYAPTLSQNQFQELTSNRRLKLAANEDNNKLIRKANSKS